MLSSLKLIEIAGVGFGLLYCILLIKENIWCWLFGILSSLASIYVFYNSRLYAESFLQTYYVWIGIYGWYHWNRHSINLKITEWSLIKHSFFISFGSLLSLLLAYLLESHSNASSPYLDSFITIFSFIASYQEARKILSGWLYWILINFSSVLLCWQRELYLYMILGLVYTLMSVWGYLKWKKLIVY